MTAAELELRGAKEDAVVENTEIILYDMLIRMAQLMKVEEAISVLTQNLSEEKSMANWIKTSTPEMITQLLPEIEASVVKSEEEAPTTTMTRPEKAINTVEEQYVT